MDSQTIDATDAMFILRACRYAVSLELDLLILPDGETAADPFYHDGRAWYLPRPSFVAWLKSVLARMDKPAARRRLSAVQQADLDAMLVRMADIEREFPINAAIPAAAPDGLDNLDWADFQASMRFVDGATGMDGEPDQEATIGGLSWWR